MRRAIFVALLFVLWFFAMFCWAQWVAAEDEPPLTHDGVDEYWCAQWKGSPYELRHSGCIHIAGTLWVVDNTFCPYVAYTIRNWREYLYDTSRITHTDAQINREIGSYGCVLSDEGQWLAE